MVTKCGLGGKELGRDRVFFVVAEFGPRDWVLCRNRGLARVRIFLS